jgi:hypothetical protein
VPAVAGGCDRETNCSPLPSSLPFVPACRAFKYFVWLNSSVRGPFLPAYHPASMHWTAAFVRKLRGDVKLVGSTINCGGAYALSAQQPHIQSYAVAMDQVRRQHSLVGVENSLKFSVEVLSGWARPHVLCESRSRRPSNNTDGHIAGETAVSAGVPRHVSSCAVDCFVNL